MTTAMALKLARRTLAAVMSVLLMLVAVFFVPIGLVRGDRLLTFGTFAVGAAGLWLLQYTRSSEGLADEEAPPSAGGHEA